MTPVKGIAGSCQRSHALRTIPLLIAAATLGTAVSLALQAGASASPDRAETTTAATVLVDSPLQDGLVQDVGTGGDWPWKATGAVVPSGYEVTGGDWPWPVPPSPAPDGGDWPWPVPPSPAPDGGDWPWPVPPTDGDDAHKA